MLGKEWEKLFNGSYDYKENGQSYSQELFSVYRHNETNHLFYMAEILSRVSTGEFLKIVTEYEVNNQWTPQRVKIHKTMGDNFAIETYLPDFDKQLLNYEFTNNEGTHTLSNPIVTRYQIATPAISTSMLCSLAKKFDSLSRSVYIIVSSDNAWKYNGPYYDRSIFVEYKTHEKTVLTINEQQFNCIKCLAYKQDTNQQSTEVPTTFYLSKHMGLPYKVESENVEVVIRNLHKTKRVTLDDL